MKKLFLIICLILTTILTAGCNRQVFDLNYKFTKVHVFETGKCYEIEKWRDYDSSDQIQVEIKNYGVCLFHSNQVVLVVDKCPFCDK